MRRGGQHCRFPVERFEPPHEGLMRSVSPGDVHLLVGNKTSWIRKAVAATIATLLTMIVTRPTTIATPPTMIATTVSCTYFWCFSSYSIHTPLQCILMFCFLSINMCRGRGRGTRDRGRECLGSRCRAGQGQRMCERERESMSFASDYVMEEKIASGAFFVVWKATRKSVWQRCGH